MLLLLSRRVRVDDEAEGSLLVLTARGILPTKMADCRCSGDVVDLFEGVRAKEEGGAGARLAVEDDEDIQRRVLWVH